MSHHDTEIEATIVAKLRERIGQERFELWFGTRTQFRYETERLHISAANPFSRDVMRKNFLRDIRAIIDEVVGPHISIEFATIAPTPNVHPEPATPQLESADDATSGSQPAGRTPVNTGRRKFATLDAFVVGSCNRVPFSAAQLVAGNLGKVSPLLISGPNGSGKSHLLEGIWSSVRFHDPRRRIVYLTSEQFTTYFLESLRGRGLPSFRRKYRDVELLVLDDIQFFAGKQATVVELLYTIDSLLRDGRQIVMAADRPLAELTDLGPELMTRLSGGLACQLEPLDRDTRGALLTRLAQSRGIPISPEVSRRIVETTSGDARQLSGILNRLQITSQATGLPVDASLVEPILQETGGSQMREIALHDIERAVCDIFGIDRKGLHSEGRTKTVSQPRMLAMWLARKHTGAALAEISRHFGRRSHSSVVAAQHKVQSWIHTGTTIRCHGTPCRTQDLLERIERQLRVG